jgi:hypothetical protein
MAIGNIEKRTRGRPKTDATPIMVRVPPVLLSDLDAWIAKQEVAFTRPEAIRAILAATLQVVSD